ncbi:MAG: EAL domain-containing protein [Actinomycetes bacterium]
MWRPGRSRGPTSRPLVDPFGGAWARPSLSHGLSAGRARLRRAREHSRLRSALGLSTPEITHQPQVCLRTGEVVGVETLVRWRSPDGRLLETEAVIGMAEHSGAIVDVGVQVLRAAAEQAVVWRAAGHRLRMSVNLSVRQLAWPHLVEALDGVLARTRLPAEVVTLEVTETFLAADVDGALGTLRHLREGGFQLALDDFGVGHSGLDHLRRLTVGEPVIDEVKIDQVFLRSAGDSARGTALLSGMVRIGRDLGLRVVGEGVESADDARLLRSLGCSVGQGYAFSKAMPATEVEEFLRLGCFDLDAPEGDDGRIARVPASAAPLLDVHMPEAASGI